MNNDSIKENIRNIRKSRKMTQEDMADKLGLSLTAYRDLERGKTTIVNSNTFNIAKLLGVTPEEVILGYKPKQSSGRHLEDVHAEYGGRISVMERRISDLEKLVSTLEETLSTKNEIISMLKKKLGEVE